MDKVSDTDSRRPLDVRQSWLDLVRRMQSLARTPSGNYAVLKVTILVDDNGDPASWFTPILRQIEPRKQDLRELYQKNPEAFRAICESIDK